MSLRLFFYLNYSAFVWNLNSTFIGLLINSFSTVKRLVCFLFFFFFTSRQDVSCVTWTLYYEIAAIVDTGQVL